LVALKIKYRRSAIRRLSRGIKENDKKNSLGDHKIIGNKQAPALFNLKSCSGASEKITFDGIYGFMHKYAP